MRTLAASASKPMKVMSGAALVMLTRAFLPTLLSMPTGRSTTMNFSPASLAAAHCATMPSTAVSTSLAPASFFSAIMRFSSALCSACRRALRPAGMTAEPSSTCRLRSSSSSSGKWSALHVAYLPSISPPLEWALSASSRVTATMRRMPFAMDDSSTTWKRCACDELRRCVPPHSSTDRPPHAALSGSATSFGTSSPMATTRTGSG
mmetsp:Transcript_18991/g.67067  ORF Transcript_18991/g.67067 Transcript_18991/m.67067 type:complete len:206 (-) Transcript_18991:1843-2460(-)